MANGLTDIRKFLDPLRLPDDVKARVWDEFYAVQTPEEFKQRFDSLEIPDDVKANLWDVKFQPSLSKTELMQRARETSPAAGFAWRLVPLRRFGAADGLAHRHGLGLREPLVVVRARRFDVDLRLESGGL